MLRDTIIILFAACAFTTGDDDAVRSRLARAKGLYEETTAVIRRDVLDELQSVEDSVRKRTGDKARIDVIKSQRRLFESRRVWPTVIPTTDYRRRLQRARIELENTYVEVVRDYTKAGDDEAAGDLQKELLAILTGSEHSAGAKSLDGRYFKVFSQVLSWHDAKRKCEEMGGHLAIVTSERENRFLLALVQSENVEQAWLGATDEQQEGRWTWIDGSINDYSNWHRWGPKDREPNNCCGGEHYLVIRPSLGGRWCDVAAEDSRSGFICEWD